ncbi:MAG: putative DNA binding domain-containing protein, partial [Selenomonas sp.]|nr:putative DNA binding domain-containing protein [Selenomonas sp.]
MFPKENEHTEYKRELTDVLKKEVIAFANTNGGSIYIGIADDGTVVGVSDSDQTMLRLASMLRDSIHPDIMMFTDMRVEQIEQHDVIHLTIASGTNKPYYLISKGLKPSGVYVRQGSASVPASPEQIRQLIKTADGDVMEDNISLNQELTFQKTTAIFAAKGLQLAGEQKFSLGLQRHDGVYTNLGLLLSDQCPFTIKTAVFSGTNQKNFQDRREFSGPLFSQLEDCYAYLQLNNPTTAEFSGLYRNDFKAYPDDALREALLNCIIHRDYAFSSSILISIYDNRMEFTSIGGLMPGLEKADIMLGISLCRNPKLANIFYRLELIEAYGTGLPKI